MSAEQPNILRSAGWRGTSCKAAERPDRSRPCCSMTSLRPLFSSMPAWAWDPPVSVYGRRSLPTRFWRCGASRVSALDGRRCKPEDGEPRHSSRRQSTGSFAVGYEIANCILVSQVNQGADKDDAAERAERPGTGSTAEVMRLIA